MKTIQQITEVIKQINKEIECTLIEEKEEQLIKARSELIKARSTLMYIYKVNT